MKYEFSASIEMADMGIYELYPVVVTANSIAEAMTKATSRIKRRYLRRRLRAPSYCEIDLGDNPLIWEK